jgi:AcrR family transcriptional regulator
VRSVLRELAKIRYAHLSTDGIARRAGVGEGPLYRRRSDKEDMTLNLVSKVGLHIVTIDKQDSVELDLLEHVRRPAALLRRPLRDESCRISTRIHVPNKIGQKTVHKKDSPRRSSPAPSSRAQSVGMEMHEDVDRSIALDAVARGLFWRLVVSRESLSNGYNGNLVQMLVSASTAGKPHG